MCLLPAQAEAKEEAARQAEAAATREQQARAKLEETMRVHEELRAAAAVGEAELRRQVAELELTVGALMQPTVPHAPACLPLAAHFCARVGSRSPTSRKTARL